MVDNDDTTTGRPNRDLPKDDTPSRGDKVRVSSDQTIVDDVFERVVVKMPERIGSFIVVKELGTGAMGTVYHAVQDNPHRDVAIKVMNPGTVSKKSLRRFQFEAQVLANLNHSAIAQIYEAGTYNDGAGERPYFAMEYITDARELDKWVDLRRLTLPERLSLFRALCDGVEYGHRNGIIHRDLKPENILINAEGRPKIIDFGVARSADTDAAVGGTLATEAGRLIGTLQYMSPEQVEMNPDQLDTRTDVYALGVIFYELLCERLPYDVTQQTMHEAARIIVQEPPIAPSTIERRLRGDLETICLKALEKDRDRRYGSAQAFADDIRRFQEHEPIEARPPSVGYRTRKFVQKHRATTAAAMVLLLVIIVGAIVSIVGWREADRGWAEAQRQTDRVKEKNLIIRDAVDRLLTTVMGQIQHLGNSAPAKRALLGVVNDTAKHIHDDSDSPAALRDQAFILVQLAHSHLSTSGVGFGDTDDAVALLEKARKALNSIAPDAPLTPSLAASIQGIRFDTGKYLAEAQEERASVASDDAARVAALGVAADIYRSRAAEGLAYQDSGGDVIMALDAQLSSLQGLGVVLERLGDANGALGAYREANRHALKLLDLDTSARGQRMRDNAISLQAIVKLDQSLEPEAALELYAEVIDVFNSLVTLNPNNVRAPRDLATALFERGWYQCATALNGDAGMADFELSVELFIQRAINSGEEGASQRELQMALYAIASLLDGTEYVPQVRQLFGSAIAQLQSMAQQRRKAGDPTWSNILTRLNARAKELTLNSEH